MEKIIITGSTGQLGKGIVAELLKKTDAKNVSVLVRSQEKAEFYKNTGVTVFLGDYMDYESLLKAFKGQDKLFFISSGDLNDRLKQHENVVKAAVEAKVKHIIYTSFQRKNETESSPIWMLASVHIATEKMIKESGLTYTILKNGVYADFLPALLGNNVFENNTIYLPAGDGKAAFTLRSDLAAGSAAILISGGHENKTYDFCADQTYSFNDIANYLSEISGKKISYVSPSLDEYKATLSKEAVPALYIGMFAGSATAIKQGEFDLADVTLSRLLGRKCTSLKDFLAEVYKK